MNSLADKKKISTYRHNSANRSKVKQIQINRLSNIADWTSAKEE